MPTPPLKRAAVLLLGGFVLLWLLDRAGRDPALELPGDAVPDARDFDYFITDMRSTHFTAQGSPSWQLVADRITHFPDTEFTTVEMPRFTAFPRETPPWQAQARSGTLSPDPLRGSDALVLVGDVRLRQDAADGSFTSIDTDTLTLFPDTEEAATQARVVLQTPDTRLEATGLHAWLGQRRIQLLNEVTGSHAQAEVLP